MKKVMWSVSFLPLIATAFALRFLPESIPMHYDLAGNIDRWGSKYESLIYPVILLLMAVFWTLLMRSFEKKARQAADEKERAGAKSNVKVLGITGIATSVLFAVIHGFSLYKAFRGSAGGTAGETADIGQITVILMGILYIVLGNFMTKTRINSVIGVRTSQSMYNETTWRKSNRFGAIVLMISGALTILLAALIKSSFPSMMASLGLLAAATVAIVIYARKVYDQEIEKEKEEKEVP